MAESKMKPLFTNQKVLTWLGILNFDENTSKLKKIFPIIFIIGIILIELFFIISSGVFISKNASTDLEVCLYAIYQAVAVTGLIYMLLSALIQRSKMADMFKTLSNLYSDSENEDSQRFLAWANSKSEWFWKKYLKFVVIGFLVSTMISITIPILICLIQRDFDTKRLYHVFKLVFPWNDQSPVGYFYEVCYAIVQSESYLFLHGTFMLLFMSICLHHQAFYETFRYKLRDFNENENIKEFLRDLIRYHNSVHHFFMESANVYSPFVLIQLICWMLMLAVCTFQLDLLFKHFSPDICLILAAITVIGTTLFIYCYFGKSATDNFSKMTDSLYEINWYEAPVDSQKYFILMIQNMQQPVNYHGFGVAVLNLETFTTLMRAVMTYYMMFKTITTN